VLRSAAAPLAVPQGVRADSVLAVSALHDETMAGHALRRPLCTHRADARAARRAAATATLGVYMARGYAATHKAFPQLTFTVLSALLGAGYVSTLL